MGGTGIVCNLGATVVNTTVTPTQAFDFCHCDYECVYEEPAFVNLADLNNKHENDKKEVLVTLPDDSGSVDFFLINSSTGQEIPLIDNTYGVNYPFPYFGDKAGYVVEWKKVVPLLGYCVYQIKAVIDSFGTISEQITHRFKVLPFSEENADNTVKVRSIHNGYIEGGFNYTGMSWERNVRFYGNITDFNPTPTIDNYENRDRVITQIKTSLEIAYSLNLFSVPESVFDSFFKDHLLANEVYLNDFNLFAPVVKMRDKLVYWSENNEIKSFVRNRNLKISLKMIESNRNIVKRQW
jgi:hypothetical protein